MLLDSRDDLVVGQRGRAPLERRIRLERELVPRDMRRLERDGSVEIRDGARRVVAGETVHQIEIEITEARGTRRHDGRFRFCGIVDAAESA